MSKSIQETHKAIGRTYNDLARYFTKLGEHFDSEITDRLSDISTAFGELADHHETLAGLSEPDEPIPSRAEMPSSPWPISRESGESPTQRWPQGKVAKDASSDVDYFWKMLAGDADNGL